MNLLLLEVTEAKIYATYAEAKIPYKIKHSRGKLFTDFC